MAMIKIPTPHELERARLEHVEIAAEKQVEHIVTAMRNGARTCGVVPELAALPALQQSRAHEMVGKAMRDAGWEIKYESDQRNDEWFSWGSIGDAQRDRMLHERNLRAGKAG